jgi:hypothetical protein
MYSGQTNKLVVLNIYCDKVEHVWIKALQNEGKVKTTGIENEWNAKTDDWKNTGKYDERWAFGLGPPRWAG